MEFRLAVEATLSKDGAWVLPVRFERVARRLPPHVRHRALKRSV
jgi:hypothetical protein